SATARPARPPMPMRSSTSLRSGPLPTIRIAMTATPAIEVTVQTATVVAIMKPIERLASRLSSRMPMMLTTTAMIATRSEIQVRSDHAMPPGSSDAAAAWGFMRHLPRARPGQSRCLRLVPVADSPYGHDAPGHRRVGLELLAQPPHVHGDGRGVAERPAPHLGEQLLPGEGLARVPHQEDQQVVLPGGQLDQLAVGPDLVRGQVHDQVPVGDGAEVELVRQAGAPGPAQHRAHPEG